MFIPTIQFTLMIIMCHYFPEIALPEPLLGLAKHLNIGVLALTLAMQIAYFRVDVITAIVYFIWSTAQVISSQHLYENSK